MLFRAVEKKINEWIANGKNALLITGARQVGKTFLIRECLKNSNKSYIELNFIEQPELIQLFAEAKDTQSLIARLSLVSNTNLIKGETILFLDEVQEYKDIVTRIKFLVDEGSFRYVLSGSLLGVELRDLRSAPVGYLAEEDMFPLTFEEFVRSLNVGENVLKELRTCFELQKEVDKFIHEKMMDLFYLYAIIGGMPKVVDTYIRTNDLKQVAEIQQEIVRLYKMDFAKYESDNKLRLREIYDTMAGQLDAKNKRFQFNKVGKGLDYDRTANNFLWLKDAGVALPVYNISEPRKPLMLSENRNLFKLFFSDVGLLTSFYSPQTKVEMLSKSPDINNGSLFENVVAQELVAHHMRPYYFNSKKQGELDFVIEMDGRILPIEVKSGKDYKKHSALENVFKVEGYGIEEAVILCNGNTEKNGKRLYLPIYMVMFLKNTDLDHLVVKVDLA